jgi:endonuclease-8
VLRTGALRRDPVLARIGPDLLAPGFEAADSIRLLRAAPDRELGDALLDQGKVAGIGNIFKSEACFAAKIDPWHPLADVSEEDLRLVLEAARDQMLSAVKLGNRHRFRVYKHRGPCSRCRGTVHHRGQGDANRTTWWCERCQV